MSREKKQQQLEKIKDAIHNTKTLTQEEKSSSLKHVEEWIAEDKANGIFYEELLKISQKFEPILAEVGLE